MKTTVQVEHTTAARLLQHKVSNRLKSMDAALNELLDAEDEHNELMDHRDMLPELTEEAIAQLSYRLIDNKRYSDLRSLWSAIEMELEEEAEDAI